ncbi:MAG: hypothetical protein ACOX2L_00170 [Anaerolineae bacterium]|jgi:fused signal recognition particle receptor|nr:hypothetical protein [Chloroflexota bacterium]
MTKPTAPLHASLEPALRPLLAALCRARPQSPLARQLGGAARSEAPMSATPLSAAPLSEAPLSAAPLSQAPMPVALSVLPPAPEVPLQDDLALIDRELARLLAVRELVLHWMEGLRGPDTAGRSPLSPSGFLRAWSESTGRVIQLLRARRELAGAPADALLDAVYAELEQLLPPPEGSSAAPVAVPAEPATPAAPTAVACARATETAGAPPARVAAPASGGVPAAPPAEGCAAPAAAAAVACARATETAGAPPGRVAVACAGVAPAGLAASPPLAAGLPAGGPL